MDRRLRRVGDLSRLEKLLGADLRCHDHFLWRVFRAGDGYKVYSTEDMGTVMAVQDTEDHVVFTGNWDGVDVPRELVPVGGFFVSASPPAAVETLKGFRELGGEWPCWYYLAPDGYGPGEWDGLGSLVGDDVSFIAPFWELGGDDREQHIRESVARFDSACLRLDGKPVSWCGLHFYLDGIGNLGFAHTLAEHRKKGYQALVTKALVNRLHRKGGRATADVIKENAASVATCKSLGFEVVREQTWAEFKPA